MKVPLQEILSYFDSRSFPEGYHVLCKHYGEKVIDSKIDKVARKHYIEYGVSARSGWLTDKGREKLAELPHLPK